jgi:hypothetical protein
VTSIDSRTTALCDDFKISRRLTGLRLFANQIWRRRSWNEGRSTPLITRRADAKLPSIIRLKWYAHRTGCRPRIEQCVCPKEALAYDAQIAQTWARTDIGQKVADKADESQEVAGHEECLVKLLDEVGSRHQLTSGPARSASQISLSSTNLLLARPQGGAKLGTLPSSTFAKTSYLRFSFYFQTRSLIPTPVSSPCPQARRTSPAALHLRQLRRRSGHRVTAGFPSI